MQFKSLFLIFTLFIFTVSAAPADDPKRNEPKLHGNFLHITDFHPDPDYRIGTTESSSCHHNSSVGSEPEPVLNGTWGNPASSCDSPLNLINATFDWLEKNWKNKLDFIIWTGDSSRHDRDDQAKRTLDEIIELNGMISEKFLKIFANIPIVPSIGNNDAPNATVTKEVLEGLYCAWCSFIPKGQSETFLKGGYYYTEVIPGKLIVVSLNTLYFFKNTKDESIKSTNDTEDNNGCKKDQPGGIQMKWLEDVLKKARKDGKKVYITGHIAPRIKHSYNGIVIPRAKRYTVSCYEGYIRLSLEYRDIILGHYYGHSNMDNFFFIGSKNNNKNQPLPDKEKYDTVTEKVDEYMYYLFKNYHTLVPLLPDEIVKNYVVVNINPSVIPTYFPALRILEYNANGSENTFLTPLSYNQYFINLTRANLQPNVKPEFEIEYTTRKDYNMSDLTILSWIQLAKNIANNGIQGTLWEKIHQNLLVGTKPLIYGSKV